MKLINGVNRMKKNTLNGDEPLYKQVKKILEKEITSHKFKIDEKLPSERILAKQFNVSMITIKQALNDLASEQYIVKRAGIGSFVNTLSHKPNRKEPIKKNICAVMSRRIKGGLNNPFFGQIIEVLEDELRKQGYFLSIMTVEEGLWIDESVKERIENRDFSGYIIIGQVSDDFIKYLVEAKAEVVLIDFPTEEAKVGNVLIDNVAGGYQITEYLIKAGHKEIGYVGGKINDVCSKERYRGYINALEANGLGQNADFVKVCGLDHVDGYKIAEQIFVAKKKPTALVCVNDSVALGILQFAAENGISIPAEMSITGFDDIDASKNAFPRLTTVSVDRSEMGREGVRKLLDMLNTDDDKIPNKIILKTELILRNSCLEFIRQKDDFSEAK